MLVYLSVYLSQVFTINHSSLKSFTAYLFIAKTYLYCCVVPGRFTTLDFSKQPLAILKLPNSLSAVLEPN